jgi:hypothetical protein
MLTEILLKVALNAIKKTQQTQQNREMYIAINVHGRKKKI